MPFRQIFEACIVDPTPELVASAFEEILLGRWSTAQIAAFVGALRVHGDDAKRLAAAARVLREHMVVVDHGLAATLDTCGTGGDGKHSINVSTGAAIVVAARGVHVAKHGNRSVSSKSGSADIVEALGVNLSVEPASQADVLRDAGICFMMAPTHHPALAHAAEARRDLGVRTLFNALGPLANPARTSHQLLGVYSDELRPLAADALMELGITRAWVVHSEDGLDEISPCAPTRVSVVENGAVTFITVRPEDFGMTPLSPDALAGGTGTENAAVLRRILEGAEHPARDIIALNAAAAFVVAKGVAPKDAFDAARTVIADGRARAKLDAWRTRTQAVAATLPGITRGTR